MLKSFLGGRSEGHDKNRYPALQGIAALKPVLPSRPTGIIIEIKNKNTSALHSSDMVLAGYYLSQVRVSPELIRISA